MTYYSLSYINAPMCTYDLILNMLEVYPTHEDLVRTKAICNFMRIYFCGFPVVCAFEA